MRGLHPEARAYLARVSAAADTPYSELPVAQARAQLLRASVAGGQIESVHDVRELRIPGPAAEIPARIYLPGPPVGDPGYPIVMAFHGGCWYLGNLDSFDAASRRLANQAGCIVISVDYRLAPEHRFPAAVEDCLAATAWAFANASSLGGDARRLAVYGSSAGGNLAAAAALMARDRGGPPLACQVLVVPMIDCRFDSASYRDNANGYGATLADMTAGWERYLAAPGDAANPYACPIRAASLAGLPPAVVVTAEFDPLRDEGDAYAARLAADGVPTRHLRCAGMVHGYRGAQADRDIAAALKAAFRSEL